MLDIMEAGNKQEINNSLLLFRERGEIVFERILSVPSSQRIPALIETNDGRARVSAAIAGSLKSAMDNVNLRVGLSEDQIFDLAEAIIDESMSDNLSLEDVLLFLKELITGKAGKIYDRLDMPTFFELFETYRQKRHQSLLEFRENEHLKYKSLGDPDRSVKITSALDQHLHDFSTKLQVLKDELHTQKAENKRLRNQN